MWDSSEQERKRRKKEKKKEEKRKKKEAAGGRGVKEEEAATNIQEVKAEMEDVAVEGDAGGGGLVVTPWLRGEASYAWGLSHANQRNVLTVQGALESGYSPNAPLFSSPEVTYITLRWAFRRLLRHRVRNKGAGGGGAHRGGMGTETPAGKAPVPHPPTYWGRGFDAGQSFYGPAGGLDAGVPLGTVVPPLGGKGVGEGAPLPGQVGVHPPVGIHFWGGV